ncbi:MAG: lysophospholipid acyltransferase family protein [Methylococcales bacterium]
MQSFHLSSLRLLHGFEYAYRVLATAICYVSFGFLAIVIWSIGFPLISLLVAKPNRLKVAHLTAYYCFRFFIGLMRFLRVLSYEVIGEEKLVRHGQLIVANHPSLIDIVFLISRVNNAVCIVSKELLNNPFMSSAIKHGGYVVNRDPESLVVECTTVLQQQMSLIIFPQGTRTPLSGQFKFQRGSARIAIQAQASITPVYIECHPPHLMKGHQWYNIPLTRPHYRIIVGDAIIPEQHFDSALPSLASRQLTRFLERYFIKQYDIAKQ